MTKETQYDVTAVGNAIVDALSQIDENFLRQHHLTKGMMTLIDKQQSTTLFNAMTVAGKVKQQSGGSAANTIAGIASFGGKCGFIGKVSDDELGHVFKRDMQAQGVDFDTPFNTDVELSTAKCLSFITPDADRTMMTYLGASTELAPDDLDINKIRNAKVTYLEGYLFDKDMAKEAFNASAIMAHTAGKMVSLTLSDPFCVNRHRADFANLVNGHIDMLFCNEQELLTLYGSDDFEAALSRVADSTQICAVTQGHLGATVVFNGERFKIPVTPVARVVDTTGAGDLFAAGFLYGFTQGLEPYECGLLGSKAAAEIISHVGARPETELKQLLAA